VWLSTFTREDEAVQRFYSRDTVTNFHLLAETDPDVAAELRFVTSLTKAEVVDMLRKLTYPNDLALNRRAFAATAYPSPPMPLTVARDHLFNNTVTPRDMGKLNRLVNPKQHAEKHFPLQLPVLAGEC
jgi:RAV-like factor